MFMSNEECDIRKEAFITQLLLEDKIVQFPHSESFAEKLRGFYCYMLKKELIHPRTYSKVIKKITGLTLSDKMYKEYVDILNEDVIRMESK